jgi:hypothetical protein
VPESVDPDISDLVQRIGESGQLAAADELVRIRDYFGRRVLPSLPNRRVRMKHDQHVVTREEWPSDTTEVEYLESLRTIVTDWRSGVYLARDEIEGTWTLYFVGRVRRSWRGRMTGQRVVVLFNGEQQFWITGFQADEGDYYVDQQGGSWLKRPS